MMGTFVVKGLKFYVDFDEDFYCDVPKKIIGVYVKIRRNVFQLEKFILTSHI